MRVLRTSLLLLLSACASCARSADDWRKGLEATDPFERGMCALGLARVAPADCGDAIPRLLELVDGRDERMREAARAALVSVAPANVPQIVANFTTVEDASRDFRAALREALVAAGQDAVAPLCEHLVDAGVSNPREIGSTLAEIGASAVEPLLAGLVDPDPRRRVAAAWTLGRMRSIAAPAVPALRRTLAEDHAAVAQQAALALVAIAPADESTRSGIEAQLARRANEPAAGWREALARLVIERAALGRDEQGCARLLALGAEALAPAVEGCSSKAGPARALAQRYLRARFAALVLGLGVERLGAAPPPGERERLQSALDDKDPGTRARTLVQVASLGRAAAPCLDALVARSLDPDPGVALVGRLALVHVVRGIALEGSSAPR